MSTVLYILIALLLLGILITVHELGHFLAARMTGIAVKEFAIGFGPKLVSWKGKKHETVYSLRLLPLGGFNAFYGEDDVTGESQEDPRAFGKQAVWRRMITILMGPAMNFILAFLVMVGWLWIGGLEVPTAVEPFISEVESGRPAEAAGLLAGDVILIIDGVDVQDGTTDALTQAIKGWQPENGPMQLTVKRGEQTLTIALEPFWDEAESRWRLGILLASRITASEHVRLTLWDAVTNSWDSCVYVGGAILRALRDLFTTPDGYKNTSGPVGTISIISEEVRTGGVEAFLNLLVVISINLGLINLMPIPGLDGSRFLFLVLEGIRRKPIPQKAEAIINLTGMALLFGLMIFLTFNDVTNLFK